MTTDKIVPCDLCGHIQNEPFLNKCGGFYTRCASCGFVYTNPVTLDLSAHNETYYNKASEKYIRKHFSKKHQKKCCALLTRFKAYLSRLRLKGDRVILLARKTAEMN